MMSETHSVLLVTKDNKISSFVSTMLMAPVFEVTVISDFNEARRMVSERNYTIILVDSGDGSDTSFAIDVSDGQSAVIVLVPSTHFDQISYRVESYGILTASKPMDAFYFYNMIKAAIAFHYKIMNISSQTMKLKEKMEEIRVVNRAKMLLMQHEGMTEQEAHRHLEKQAMDSCMKRAKVAEQIIKNYSE